MPFAQDQNTGKWYEVDAQGNAIREVQVGAQPTGAIPIGPRNSRQAKDQVDMSGTQAATTGKLIDNEVTAATAPAVIQKAGAEADLTGAKATQAQQGTRMNGLSDAQYSDALNQFNGGLTIRKQNAALRTAYNRGPGSTKGFAGLLDFFPTPDNQRFNKAADRMRAFTKQGTGTTGGENNSLSEMKLNLGAYIPSSSNFDATNVDNFGAIDDLGDKAVRQSIQRLGGVPDQNGNIFPLGSPEANRLLQGYGMAPDLSPMHQAQQRDPNQPPMAMVGVGGGGQGGGGPTPLTLDDYASPNDPSGPQGVASGLLAGPRFIKKPDPQMSAHLDNMYRSGASFEQINAYAVSQGADPIDRASFESRKKWDEKYRQSHGGRSYNGPAFDATREVEQSWWDRGAQGAPGAAAIGFTNAASFGGVGALAPEKMAMAQQAHPYAEGIGEIAGVLAGQKLGGNLLGGIGGRTGMGANALAKFRALPAPARNLIADTGYGAVRGGVENPDNPGIGALMGAGTAGAGSVLGQGAGRVIGAGLGGVKMAPGVQTLLNARIPMTTGQMMGGRIGGIVKGVEDRAMSMPVVGDMIRARRTESLDGLTRAAETEAGAPINAQFAPGGNWADELPPQFGQAYDNATAGVQTNLDSTFKRDLGNVVQQGQRLPEDYRAALQDIGRYRVTPAIEGGTLSGPDYQQAIRGLKAAKAGAPQVGKAGFESEYRDALSGVQNALRGQMMRNGGEGVVSGLQNADKAYGMAKALQNAQRLAKGRQVTPGQLATSSMQALRKYGSRPFAELADAAQNVLPNTIPDSGTAGRVAQMAALPVLGGSAGYAASGGDTGTALKGATLAALLAAAGSKAGQTAINAALFKRPDTAKALGALIRKQKGLLGTNTQRAVGTASLPLLLGAYSQ